MMLPTIHWSFLSHLPGPSLPEPAFQLWHQLLCVWCGHVVVDALAYGKSAEELAMENVPEDLRPHKTFPGTHQNETRESGRE